MKKTPAVFRLPDDILDAIVAQIYVKAQGHTLKNGTLIDTILSKGLPIMLVSERRVEIIDERSLFFEERENYPINDIQTT